jgi:hypothetical protein
MTPRLRDFRRFCPNFHPRPTLRKISFRIIIFLDIFGHNNIQIRSCATSVTCPENAPTFRLLKIHFVRYIWQPVRIGIRALPGPLSSHMFHPYVYGFGFKICPMSDPVWQRGGCVCVLNGQNSRNFFVDNYLFAPYIVVPHEKPSIFSKYITAKNC